MGLNRALSYDWFSHKANDGKEIQTHGAQWYRTRTVPQVFASRRSTGQGIILFAASWSRTGPPYPHVGGFSAITMWSWSRLAEHLSPSHTTAHRSLRDMNPS